MSSGTLTLKNNSTTVSGSGTSFDSEISGGDFIVVTVGGIVYTLPVESVSNNTEITLVSNYHGPDISGAAWYAVPRVALNTVTAGLVAQSTEALRGLNHDKKNWQRIFSDDSNVIVTLPDGANFAGPSWPYITKKIVSMDKKIDIITDNYIRLDDTTRLAGVIGTSRNIRLNIPKESATATMIADEIIVATGLGRTQYRLANFNKTIDLKATGAGGMDTGTAPRSGFVALYAIYNPKTQESALLASDATASIAAEVYGGTAMPVGYTASALVSVLGTTSGSVFKIAIQTGRKIGIRITGIVNSSSPTATARPAQLTESVPKNAVSFNAIVNISNSTQTAMSFNTFPLGSGGAGSVSIGSTFTYGITTTLSDITIYEPQLTYYNFGSDAQGITLNFNCTGYTI